MGRLLSLLRVNPVAKGGGGRADEGLYALPVAGLVMRSPYPGLKYVPDLAVAGPTELTGFDSEVTYRRRLRSGWGLSFFHRMTLLEYPDPLPVDWVVHRVGIRLETGR